ncbi:DciA family protein [Corynebacterium poyangense]|uniref:DciA family protein n=1 Tax=Corynebacterium poyangense TaxID=2684405 RepID=UPI002961F37B|nr:DciA family protein [Corynebacterium poyangense]
MISEGGESQDRPLDLVDYCYQRWMEQVKRRGGKNMPRQGEGSRRIVKERRDDRRASISGIEKMGLSSRVRNYQKTGRDGRPLSKKRQLPTIGNVLDSLIHSEGWAPKLARGWVMEHWPDLVGPKIAEHTTVEMFKETTLIISCDSTAWASNLRLMQKKILQNIAEKVGPDIVTTLHFYGPNAPSWRKGRLHVKGRGPRDTYG